MINRANLFNDLGVNPEMSKLFDPPVPGNIQFKDKYKKKVEILLYDQIGLDWVTGEGVTAKEFNEKIEQAGDRDIVVRINSPGGDVWDGLAIYNMLRSAKGKVTTVVEGLAASAASIVAMAGDDVSIYPSAQLMIHSAWTIAMGNADDFREAADVLDKIDGTLAEIYSSKTGRPAEEFKQIMSKDSYYNADESLELGLVNSIVDLDKKEEPEVVASDRRYFSLAARRREIALRKAKANL